MGKENMQNLKAVLLDVDGTLVDSNDAHAQAWVMAFAKHGINVPFAKIRSLIGKGGDKLLPEVTGRPATDPKCKEIDSARKRVFLHEFLPSLKPFRRVEDLLARMKEDGLILAIASSAQDDELNDLLKVCGAEKFVGARTSSEDAENSKPDPDIISSALAKIGLPPDEVLLLGDTPYDVLAGVRASVGVVALRCGGWGDPELAEAIAIYDDVEDLLAHYAESPFNRSKGAA
jgi:HAD superfamily hydrolase (TIGR01509 family)